MSDNIPEWYDWSNAVHVNDYERDLFIQEVVTYLRTAEIGDYHYVATGDVMVLGFRERNNIRIKVLKPVRSADFPADEINEPERLQVMGVSLPTDAYDSQSADHC